MCFMLVFSAAANFKLTKTLCNCRRQSRGGIYSLGLSVTLGSSDVTWSALLQTVPESNHCSVSNVLYVLNIDGKKYCFYALHNPGQIWSILTLKSSKNTLNDIPSGGNFFTLNEQKRGETEVFPAAAHFICKLCHVFMNFQVIRWVKLRFMLYFSTCV